MQNIEQKHHITEDTWIALSNNTIAPGDYMKILEHTCGCTWCAERLASVMEEEGQAAEPPAYLREQIQERAGQLDIQTVVTAKKASKQLRLFLYSLKVGLAVVVSVFLLAVSVNIQELGMTEQQMQEEEENLLVQMNRISQNATSWMNAFSNFILNGGQ